MGTRGSYGVRIDQCDKLTYNHFDSYPEGLGQQIVEQTRALMKSVGIEGIREKARAMRLVTGDGKTSTDEQVKLAKYADTTVSTGKLTEWYVLLRKMQGDLTANLREGVMIDDNGFIQDSLFCEYAYILNLDSEELEIYDGFQKERPAESRYAGDAPDNGYWGCKLVATFPLAAIPEDWIDQAFPREPEEEDQEAAA